MSHQKMRVDAVTRVRVEPPSLLDIEKRVRRIIVECDSGTLEIELAMTDPFAANAIGRALGLAPPLPALDRQYNSALNILIPERAG